MGNSFKNNRSDDSSDETRRWKVDPGFALGVFHLGTPRKDLFQILKDENLETEDFFEDDAFYVLEMDTTLYFDTEHPQALELIEVEDERVRFGTLKVMRDSPHNIFARIASADTLWFDDLSQINRAYSDSTLLVNPTDEQLLDGGILWIKAFGIGFQLARGKVRSLFLCDPEKLPATGHGEFTAAQRDLSERMQIESFKHPIEKTHPVERIVKTGLLLIAILVAAFFGKQAWDEQKRWDDSPEVQADVVSVWPPPPEPFPSKFQLAFEDTSGEKHEVELGNNDIYGLPKVGDKISLRYLSDSPQTVKGPAKIHDIGFNMFVPYLLGTIFAYLVVHTVTDLLLGRLLKRKRARS